MNIKKLTFHPYEISLNNGFARKSLLLHITDTAGNEGWGEIAPLPKWNKETVEDCERQLTEKQSKITQIDWDQETVLKEIENLHLFPSVTFGLESALLSILSPLPPFSVGASALLMGSTNEILEQAEQREREGFRSAKLKISQLSFKEADAVIRELKDRFRLRIDVNRAWTTADSMQFFEKFSLDTFDYVEEPFQNPHDLPHFKHPLAVDESFPTDLTLKQLESHPSLKALIFKPTVQGGIKECISLKPWLDKHKIDLVLSSSFESDLGIATIASVACRLSLRAPIGIGTYFYLNETILSFPLQFSNSTVAIEKNLQPKIAHMPLC